MLNKTYRAAVVESFGNVTIKKFDTASCDERDLIVKVIKAGVCGTDVHLMYPTAGETTYPFRLGHEWLGRIEELGAKFPRKDSFGRKLKVGDRIVAYPSIYACGSCYACRMLLMPQLCLRYDFYRKLPDMNSGFADYVYIPEGSAVFKIQDHVPDDVAVLTEPLAGTLRAFERIFAPGSPDRAHGFSIGKSIAILGSGTIGCLLVILGRLSGASPIIVVGGPENRLSLCKELGADVVLDITKTTSEERLEIVRQHTAFNLGVDAAFEVAGVPSAFVDGIRIVRRGGSLVEFGHFTDRGVIPVNPKEICIQDIQIYGCTGYGPLGFGASLKVLSDNCCGRAQFEKLITHHFKFTEVQAALETAKKQDCVKAVMEFDE